MVFSNNDHDHDHQEFREPLAPSRAETDPAAQSLSDALRVSFRLLSLVMVIVLVFFLLTGVKTIKQQEVGIVKVFGKPNPRPAGPGLVINWPFPIGEVDVVPVREESLLIEDFWMYETASQKTQTLLERAAPEYKYVSIRM